MVVLVPIFGGQLFCHVCHSDHIILFVLVLPIYHCDHHFLRHLCELIQPTSGHFREHCHALAIDKLIQGTGTGFLSFSWLELVALEVFEDQYGSVIFHC